jgi:glycosyltransferase involved in cell wall biosynthesis
MNPVEQGAPVSIIIPAFNQLAYCRQCVQSILAHTDTPYKLILVDNGSTDGVAEYFDSVPGACVAHADRNLGFAGGINLGLARAEGHALLLNSDTIVPKRWLRRLLDALNRGDDIGAVGPLSNHAPGGEQAEEVEADSWDAINAHADALARRRAGKMRETARLVAFCMLIRDRVWQDVGLLDERFGIGTFEDGDYCLRIIQAGYRLCIAEDCFVYHYGNRTFIGMGLVGEAFETLIAENERRLHEKWGAFAIEHSEAALQSRQYQEDARRAMEAGDLLAALRMLKEAIAAFPLSASCYDDLGVLLARLGQAGAAFDQFVRAVRLDPDCSGAAQHLLDAAMELGREDEAREIIRSARTQPKPVRMRGPEKTT